MFKSKKFLAGSVLVIGGFFVSIFLQTNFSLHAQDVQTRSSEVSIYLGGDYQSSSFIPLTTKEEPSINVKYYYSDANNRQKRSIDNLKIDLYKISKSDILDFFTYNVNDTSRYISETLDTQDFERITSLDLKNQGFEDKVLLPIEGTGAWLVRATVDGESFNDAIILRSDIGSIVREGNDEYVFWSQQISSGKSLSAGTVEVFNLQGGVNLLDSRSLSSQGIATSAIKNNADVAIFESLDGELALIPLNIPQSIYYRSTSFQEKQIGTKYYLFTDRPLYKPGDTVNFKAIVRNDDDAVYSVPTGVVNAKAYYSSGEDPIYEKSIPLTSEGTASGSFELPELRTGYYRLEISDAQASDRMYWLRTTTSFQVENFRKPEYTLESDIKIKEYIKGDTINAVVQGQYFFGEPLSEAEVDVSVGGNGSYLNPKYFSSSKIIEDHVSYTYHYGRETKKDTVTLGANGEAQYQYDTSSFPAESQANIATFDFAYNDESGNLTRSKTNAFIWSGEYSIINAARTRSFPVGSLATVSVSLMPHNSVPISNVELKGSNTLTYWEKETANNKVGYKYVRRTEALPSFKVRTDTAGEASVSFTPERSGTYDLIFSGKDRRGNTVTYKTSVWAYDPSKYSYTNISPGSLADEVYRVSIEKDKEEYKIGDVANLLVTTNDQDRDLLLTIERNYVRRHYVVSATGSSVAIPLDLISTDIPNVYATVSGFSMNGYGQDSIEIPVSAEGKELSVDISFDKDTYSPGETVQASITTRDNTGRPVSSEVALWSVDKSLYELTTDTRRSIFDFFWQKRYNGTANAHSLEKIYTSGGAEKGCFVGDTQVLTSRGLKSIKDVRVGDVVLTRESTDSKKLIKAKVENTFKHTVDGYLVLNGYLKITPQHKLWVNDSWQIAGDIQIGDTLVDSGGENVIVNSIEWQKEKVDVYNLQIQESHTYFAGDVWVHNDKGGDARIDFTDVAYWNPHIQTGLDGRATVTFTLPDNLTTWVSSAVAVTSDTRVGESKKEMVVTKPVIIRPILPNLIRTGDKAELSSLIYNFTNIASDFVAMCQYQDTQNDSKFKLEKGQFEQVLFSAVSPNKEDLEAQIFCEANALQAKESDSIINLLPIKQFGFEDYQTQVGSGNTTFNLSINTDTDRDLSKVSLTLTPSIFGTLPEAMRYLIRYPYGCTEQTTSRLVPAVIAKENQILFADFLPNKDLDEIIEVSIRNLIELKKSGGWSWWDHTEDGYKDAFVTAYATEYLVRAERLGFEVPSWVFDDVVRGAKRISKGNTSYYEEEEQIAARYTLSLLNDTEDTSLITGSKDLSPDVLSLLVLTNINNGHTDPNTNGANQLLEKAKVRVSTPYWEAGRKDFYASQDASTALALRALTKARLYDAAEKVTQYFALNKSNRFWSNTFATAQTLDALTAYAQVKYPESQNVDYEVILDNKKIAEGVFADPFESIVLDIDVEDIKETSLLEVKTSTNSPLFSIVNNQEFRTADDLPAVSNGLSIYREYKGEFVPGETVEVVLTLFADEGYQNKSVVIHDYLPAGLIPVNTKLKNEWEYRNGYGKKRPSGIEIRDDGVVLAYQSWNGEKLTARYQARVVSRGEYTAPPAVASLMYQPEAYARSQIQRVRISDDVSKSGVIHSSDPDHAPSKVSVFTKLMIVPGIIVLIIVGVALFRIWRRKSLNKDNISNESF